MTADCSRLSSIEAWRDGRLAAEETEALRVHLALCRECASQVERLDRLGAALRALPEAEVGQARLAAERRRLLEAAGAETRGPRSFRASWLALAGTALAAGVPLLAWKAPWHLQTPGPASSALRATALDVRVEAGPGARWSRSSTQAAEVVALNDGRLHVEVARHDPTRSLVIKLPDGELRDVGTVFELEVASGRTRLVSVSQGRVLLRLHDRAELVLSAGERFEAPPDAPKAADAAASRAFSPAPVKSAGHPHTPSATPSCLGAQAFEECVGAFKSGQFSAAAGHCERYTSSCPGGGHAEDAAYLRMVALARAGQSADARVQARAYVQRFPHGFRLKEAKSIAGSD